jgi:hypothetical protein
MLTDEELNLRVISTEDSFVERKTIGDHKRWIPAFVAFANSAPVGFPCVLFIGVRDDGSLESGLGVESLQKSFDEKAADVFPPIPYQSKVFRRDGRECLALIVPGSPFRPHYAGLPYIRVGTESRKADPDDVARLLAEQDPKAREILKWRGKIVALDGLNPPDTFSKMGRVGTSFRAKVIDCNQFWVTYEYGQGALTSVSLRRVELCFDHAGGLLKLEISP